VTAGLLVYSISFIGTVNVPCVILRRPCVSTVVCSGSLRELLVQLGVFNLFSAGGEGRITGISSAFLRHFMFFGRQRLIRTV